MAQTNYTPIALYYSTTAAAAPTAGNLVNGELAINITDGKLYYKDNSGVVQVIANKATLTSVDTLSFGSTGLTPATATTGNITVGGTLITSNGGTGQSSYTAGDVLYYASGTALTKLGIGTAGQVLTVNGGGTAPQWSSVSASVTTFSAGTTGLTPSTATSGAVTLAGTLATTNGGTGLTAFTSGGAVYASSTSALTTGTLPVASGGSGAVTLTGVLKGNGTSAFTAATAGTDYVAPGTATTFTATQTFNGTSSTAAMKELNIIEPASVTGTAPTATTNFYINTGSVQYITANNANNWTLNFAFSSGTTLNSAMTTNDSLSCTLVTTNTTTAYYLSAITVDGASAGVTVKWQGGTAPTSGNASSIDSYTFVIIKTGSAVYTILASQTKFA